MNVFQSIDLQRLAGIKSILGIDMTTDNASVVVLERRGNPLNRFKPIFKVARTLDIAFEAAEALQQRAEKLRAALSKENIVTKFAVSTVHTLGMKIVRATIPPDTDDINNWINEHHDKLLKLPLPSHQISFRFEIISKSSAGTRVEITFLRNSDIDRCKELLRCAGLEVLALSAGDRDAVNALVADPSTNVAHVAEFIFIGQDFISFTSFEEGNRGEPRRIARDPVFKPGQILSQHNKNFLVAGDADGQFDEDSSQLLKPFGIESRFTLAAGLAVKGFLPELSPINFLNTEDREKSDVLVYRSMFQRVAVLLGLLLIAVLGVQMLAAYAIQKKIDAIDDERMDFGGGYAEVAMLEQQVNSLEAKLRGGEAWLTRTNTAKVLHDIAKAVPDSVWLNKLLLGENVARETRLTLLGYTTSNELVTAFLKRLRVYGNCSEATLMRAGVLGETNEVVPVRLKSSPFVAFEIRATVQR